MNYAVLLLAGKSKRFNNKISKQFYLYKNKPLYYYPLKSLNDNKDVDHIVLVTNEDEVMEVYNFSLKNKFKKVIKVIGGGDYRNESVRNAINSLKDIIHDDDIILFHDSARVILDDEIISKSISETKTKNATTYALHIYDTVVKSNKNYTVNGYLNRNEIFLLQTPQTFKFKTIYDAYKNKKITFDDTELVFLNHEKIHLLKGTDRLFKITTFDDLKKLDLFFK